MLMGRMNAEKKKRKLIYTMFMASSYLPLSLSDFLQTLLYKALYTLYLW